MSKNKNLMGKELKKSFEECFDFFLQKVTNPNAKITFKFTDEKGTKFRNVNVDYIFEDFKFKGVSLDCVDKKTQIKIIVDNMSFDHFALTKKDFHIAKPTCQGFGEYWGVDNFVFYYHRF